MSQVCLPGSSSPTEGTKHLQTQWWGSILLSPWIKHFWISINVMLCPIFRFRVGFISCRQMCSYLPMNSGRYFKISYLLWTTACPEQWTDSICYSVLSVWSHKILTEFAFITWRAEGWHSNYSSVMKKQHSQRRKKKSTINSVMTNIFRSSAKQSKYSGQRLKMKKSHNNTQDCDTGLLGSEYRVVNSPLTLLVV